MPSCSVSPSTLKLMNLAMGTSAVFGSNLSNHSSLNSVAEGYYLSIEIKNP
jgi:hypothetical protein